MRTLAKGREPQCLADARREARRLQRKTGKAPVPEDWDAGVCDADQGEPNHLRAALVRDQQKLCAYCMGRIQPRGYLHSAPSAGGMKIEHFVARSQDPRRIFDWDNLLGVCAGVYRGPNGRVDHCDTSRGATPLLLNPTDPGGSRPEVALEYTSERPANAPGESPGLWLRPCAGHEDIAGDLSALNLNAEHLAYNRYAARDSLRRQLQRAQRKGGTGAVRRLLLQHQADLRSAPPTTLPEYAGVLLDYVERKLAQMT